MPGLVTAAPWQVRPARLQGAAGGAGLQFTPPAPPQVTAPVLLPGNLLSPADSDFETALTGSWSAFLNCTIAQSTARSFSGAASLAVTATAAGAVQVFGPALPVPLNTGVVFSCYVWTASSHLVNVALFSNASIQIPGGPILSTLAGAWTPYAMATAFTAGGITSFNADIQVQGLAAGETIFIDLIYAATSGVQVLVAWPTEPGSTSPLFADMTPFTRTNQPITMTHGRQDNLSEVQPGQLTLTMSNDLGWLTEQNVNSPFYPNVKLGRRIQVSVPDEIGLWHTRFDGQINDIELEPAPTGLQADALVQAADVMALLARQQGLNPWTKQEILADSPVLHWTLDDPSGSSVAVESSGNQGPPLQLHSYGTTGTYAFAGGTAVTNGVQNGMESQTWTNIGTPAAFPSVYFKQSAGGSARTSQANWQLQSALPVTLTPATAAFTIEAFLIPDMASTSLYTSATGYTFFAFSLADPRTGSSIAIYVLGGTTPQLSCQLQQAGLGQIVDNFMNFPLTAGPLAVAVEMTPAGGGTNLVIYVNGVPQFSFAAYGNQGLAFSYLTVGGPWNGYQGWLGQISCVSIYNGALSPARLTAHASRASLGAYAQQAGKVIAAIAGYAGVPSFWNNLTPTTGLSRMDYFNLAGQNALASMQSVEQADGGVLYANVAGQLTYAGRESRMGALGPVVTLQAGHYEADLGYKMNDQFLQNESGLSSAGIATGIPAVNAQSQLDFGQYAPNGTAQSPTQVPLLTYNNWLQANLNGAGGTVNSFAADNLLWAAQWAANSHAQPSPKGASVRVDILTLPTPAGATYADLYSDRYFDSYGLFQPGGNGVTRSALFGLDLGSVIALAGLPGQFPNQAHSNEYFVEGVTETIQGGDQSVHDLVFFTSPASQGRAWIPGDPVYGKLDSTAVIGRSAPPAPPVVPAFEFAGPVFPGPPYYPPAYGSQMNTNPGVSSAGFVGDLDQAGIWANLQQQLRPPMGIAAVAAAPQSIANGTGTAFAPTGSVRLTWDTVYADTLGGFGWLAGFPNWYFCLVPGWWQLYALANFATNSTGRRAAWFLVGQRAARGGTGPVSGLNNIGPAEKAANAAFPTGVALSAKIYCTLGTAIAVQVWQNSGSALNTAITRGGCMFAARFLGDTAVQD